MTRSVRTARTALAVFAGTTALLAAGALAGCEVNLDLGGREPSGDEITQQRDVAAVTRVELRSTGTLNLAVGDEPRLTVVGAQDVLEDVTTTVDGDTLVIDLEHDWRRTGYLEYDLVLPALDTVLLSGSGEVYGELGSTGPVSLVIDGSGEIVVDELTTDALSVAVHGSGDVTVHQLGAQTVDVLVEGSGGVELVGATDRLTVSIPGSGAVDADELMAREGVVAIEGSGEADVYVTDTLDASIDGSGDITYVGDPEVSRRIDGSGEVHAD